MRPAVTFTRGLALLIALHSAAPLRIVASDTSAPEPAAPALPLTQIAEVKAWTQLAGRSLPVLIEGVVTYAAPAGNFFLHDGVLGIHVGTSEAGRGLAPGERVRVAGLTRRGTFAPSIEPGEILPLGREPLPEPEHASYTAVASGTLDGQWLEIEGVVCAVDHDTAGAGGPVLLLAIDGRRLRIGVNQRERIAPESILDAKVRLQGVATGSFNRQRQLVEPLVRVPGPSFITVVRPPPADRFAGPVVPLSRLLGFSLEAPSPHAVRIRGTVTRRVAERVLFVRDEQLGLRVEAREPVAFAPGDVIEAVGFPTMAGGAAVIDNADCRRVARSPAPPPLRPTLDALRDGSHSADLVQVRARLVDWVTATDTATLILETGGQLFRATLQSPGIRDTLPERNSLVDATGICVMSASDADAVSHLHSFMLLLADRSDLSVVRRPDWWNSERLTRALAVVITLLAAGVVWVWSLRRQIRRKRAVIEQQARHAAVLEERGRIARDLHDTLEQELTALSLQLKVVEMDHQEAPLRVGQGLNAARLMLRRSRALARHAIQRLRSDDLPQRDETLVAGLQRMADGWKHSGLDARVVVTGPTEIPLPEEPRLHLIHIAGEAMTNAIKHGHARSIRALVHCNADGVQLRIEDDGAGFEPTRATPPGAGGFGLTGMRERAAAIGAKLTIESQPGAGTAITVEVPANRCAWPGGHPPHPTALPSSATSVSPR